MTQVADPRQRADPPSPDRRHDVCPLLLAENAWRSATPAKEHRCLALGADMPLALDKQKRLCLTGEHRTCATYAAALGLGGAGDAAPAHPVQPRRPYPRMAPVVLDHGRLGVSVPIAARDRPVGQVALAALMILAFAAIAVARFAGVGDGAAGAASPDPSVGIVVAQPSPTPRPSPSPSPTPTPAASPSPSPTPTPALRTYRVRRGDTLSGIAARYDTTVRELMNLNGIDDPARLSVGAVLQLPPETP